GENLASKIGRFVGVAFSATGAAAETEGKSVLAEHIGEAFDLADIRNRDQHAILFADLLLDLLQHCWNRAMKALRRLRMETDHLGLVRARNSEVLNRRSGKAGQFLPPVVRRNVEIRGPHQIADLAAFVGFFDAGPGMIKLLLHTIGFVHQNHSLRDQVKDAAVRARNRSVKLPAGKYGNPAGTHGLLDNLLSPGDALA